MLSYELSVTQNKFCRIETLHKEMKNEADKK